MSASIGFYPLVDEPPTPKAPPLTLPKRFILTALEGLAPSEGELPYQKRPLEDLQAAVRQASRRETAGPDLLVRLLQHPDQIPESWKSEKIIVFLGRSGGGPERLPAVNCLRWDTRLEAWSTSFSDPRDCLVQGHYAPSPN
ncbi:hypothetical protein KW786_02220 [Candidatus Parcubacteria bacterium]|nr:hypothetical protein [Candidatus Parcubacteria bacterium]